MTRLLTAFAVALAAAPLPLGSNRPVAWSALALIFGLLTLAWTRHQALREATLVWRRAFWGPLALLVFTIGWVLFQMTVSLPAEWANPLWRLCGEALRQPTRSTISIAPDVSLAALMRLMTYVAVLWLALQLGRDERRAWRLLRWIGWASCAYAVYGLVNYLAGNGYILWLERWAYADDVTSSFVNRNSYATFAALGLLVAMALCMRSFRRAWHRSDRSLPRLNRWIESFVGEPLAYLLAVTVIGMAWLQSHSRMGFVAGALGVLAFVTLLLATRTIRSRVGTAVAGVGLTALLVQVSASATLERISATTVLDRAPLFALVLDAIRAAPWTGYGYGSFPMVLPMFRDLSLPSGSIYTQAHNSYLELALELGIVPAACLVAAILWAALLCLIAGFRRRSARAVPLLAVAATIVVGVHAVLDFSLQIPAVACLYAALLGLGLAQSWSDRSAIPVSAGSVASVSNRSPRS